jgi:hypothetical protein
LRLPIVLWSAHAYHPPLARVPLVDCIGQREVAGTDARTDGVNGDFEVRRDLARAQVPLHDSMLTICLALMGTCAAVRGNGRSGGQKIAGRATQLVF